MFLKNLKSHFLTVINNKEKVFYNCVRAGIVWRGIVHDLSKFSPSEFIPGVIFFQGDRSPNEAEREEKGYSVAWIHHKGRNKHHFEYWTDYNVKTKKLEPVKMPDKYVAEMFCDRVAASKTYMKEKYTDKAPLEYFLKGKNRRAIHPDTSDEIEFLLRMLADKGEDYTFSYIKKHIVHKKRFNIMHKLYQKRKNSIKSHYKRGVRMMLVIIFILGSLFGGTVGFFTSALCSASARDKDLK